MNITYNVKYNVESREAQLMRESDLLRVERYKNYVIKKESVEEKMFEPLWLDSCAILYLFGYKPTYNDKSDSKIVKQDKEMNRVYGYLIDSYKIQKVDLIKENYSSFKVKPKNFMIWAQGLNIPFPNLVTIKDKKSNNPLNTKEKETLLKLVIGMAVEQYGFDPKAKRNEATSNIRSDLESCGISMDADTILKKLREASDLLPPPNNE